MEADAKAVKRAKPKKLKKSRKAAEYHGLSGTGTDYTVYNLSSGETMLAVAVGFAVGFAAGYCYFNSVAIGVIVGLIAGWKAISI